MPLVINGRWTLVTRTVMLSLTSNLSAGVHVEVRSGALKKVNGWRREKSQLHLLQWNWILFTSRPRPEHLHDRLCPTQIWMSFYSPSVSAYTACVCTYVGAYICMWGSKSASGLCSQCCHLLKASWGLGLAWLFYVPGQFSSQVTRGHAQTEEGYVALPSITEHPPPLPRGHKETFRRPTSSRNLKSTATSLSFIDFYFLLFLPHFFFMDVTLINSGSQSNVVTVINTFSPCRSTCRYKYHHQ